MRARPASALYQAADEEDDADMRDKLTGAAMSLMMFYTPPAPHGQAAFELRLAAPRGRR
jgi:hypothetical protein